MHAERPCTLVYKCRSSCRIIDIVISSETGYVIRIVFASLEKVVLHLQHQQGIGWTVGLMCMLSHFSWLTGAAESPTLLHSFPQHPALRFTSLPHSFPLLRPEKHFIAARKMKVCFSITGLVVFIIRPLYFKTRAAFTMLYSLWIQREL